MHNQRMQVTNPTRLEWFLSMLGRLFGMHSLEEKLPLPDTEILTDLYESHMFDKGNFLYRHVLKRVVPYVRLDESNLEAVKAKMTLGPFVYVTVNLGQLDYDVFNAIVAKQGLPKAHFNNLINIRRWLPFNEIRRSYAKRIRFLMQFGDLPHPLLSGYVRNLLLEQKSLLFSFDTGDVDTLSTPSRNFLEALLLQSQKESPKPIFVIPIQLVWDKRPKREQPSLFKVLSGETEYPGKWRKLILFFKHFRKRSLVRFGAPIPLDDFSAFDLYQKIISSLEIEKRTLTGPFIRPRGWFLDRMFEDEALSRTLYEVAKEKNKPLPSVKRLARRYGKEIAADVRYSYIEFGAKIIHWIFKTFYEGVLIDPEGLKKLKKTLSLGPTVLVPNHRSHIDYLLMAHLCYTNDIVIPYVAAGINLSFFPLGFYFRHCGAFFMRRTFAGNLLYKIVFQTYLKVLLEEGYLQEFFIEGGRSRTGKLKSPKLGMLAMYSQAMHEGTTKDIRFVPVSITYDRVLEQKSYLEEVEGKPKPKEKTRDLLKLTKYLKGRYGKIYVHFDDPISWQEISGEIEEENWEKKKPKIVETLASRICHSINKQVVVIPQALAASALLRSPKRGVSLDTAEVFFKELLHYLQWKQVKLSDTLHKNPEGAYFEAVHQFETSGLIKKHLGLEETFYEIPIDKRLELDFFKNSSIHYFVSLSLWCHLLLSGKSETFFVKNLVEAFSFFQKIFHYEFRFSTRRALEEHLDKLCCYLQERKAVEYHAGEMHLLKEGRPLLRDFAALIQNYIEAYFVAWKTYLLRPIYPDDTKGLTKAMLTHGKHQLMLGEILYPEAVSQATFENAIQAFQTLGLFTSDSEMAKNLEKELSNLLDFC